MLILKHDNIGQQYLVLVFLSFLDPLKYMRFEIRFIFVNITIHLYNYNIIYLVKRQYQLINSTVVQKIGYIYMVLSISLALINQLVNYIFQLCYLMGIKYFTGYFFWVHPRNMLFPLVFVIFFISVTICTVSSCLIS